ncbi:two-component response regulator ARR11-like [Vicia villosa]|uniref:two-component response regulator ARR11-like n=1 Tax=Vicia villosa TaxID=3911 RepID=UPI00273B1D00|nr:two-component response regulator ARR11-like [Vicia villosa]
MALFSTNIKLLVVHHDAILLDQIQQMCDRCHYQLTICTSPYYALHLLAERNDYFDMMLIDVCMPNMDSYEFLQYVTIQHRIPVIVISSDGTKSSVMNSVIYGACDYWVQPLHEKQFKTMWQHVARNNFNENKAEHQVLGFLDAQSPKEDEVVGFLKAQSPNEPDAVGFLKAQNPREHDAVGFLKAQSPNEHDAVGFLEAQNPREHDVVGLLEALQHERKREREDDKPPKDKSGKKSRLSWTPQLHQQFLNAVNQIGFDEAKPRKILKRMGICGLTTAQVASHLQKYRNYLKGPSCGKKSNKSQRIDTPTKTASETEDANSVLHHEDQTRQLNSTLQSYNISETQQHSTDVTDYQDSDIGYNYEAQEHSIDYQVSDIMCDPSDLSIDYDELMSLLSC